ncbi:MAG: phytoene desaturase family protein [Deltaproteobacteria bacterium]
MLDAVVIGSGPNGLTAAATLARAGRSVLVLEAQARAGGAVGTLPLTEPGFAHDVGAAFFPFGEVSPAFTALDLAGAGLRFSHAPVESAHLAPDGSCGVISRDVERSVAALGEDGESWRRLVRWRQRMGQRFVELTLGELPLLGPALRLGPLSLAKLGMAQFESPAAFADRFWTGPAQRIVPQLALHADLGPDDFGGAAVGLVLALLAASSGFPAAEGGAGRIVDALVARLREAGGELRLQSRVRQVLVREGAVAAVVTEGGLEIETRSVLADTGAPALLLGLVGEERLPGRLVRSMRRFRYGWGTFKLDWALDGPVPWRAAPAREATVVHTGGDIPALRAFSAEVRANRLPEHPYLVVGQQSLVDPSRAPAGKQTLWAYSHAPAMPDGGWEQAREPFADRIEGELEAHAPGFRKLIRARRIWSPPELAAMNENLVGGDLGGGTAHLERQFFFRPAFPYWRYRMPVRGLYLCSASTHPGPGVHGACGWHAARRALAELESG